MNNKTVDMMDLELSRKHLDITELEKHIKQRSSGHLSERNFSIKRGSLYQDLDKMDCCFRPEFKVKQKLLDNNEKLWSLMESYLPRDTKSIQKSIVNHIEYTLSRTRFDFNKYSLYQGVALSVRDRLLESWNDSLTSIPPNAKRISYLSLEFLLGRLLQNALVNINLEDKYREALEDLGYKLEELYDKENDPALGNGGLGRLAACYLDSMATLNFPAIGYGIRYDYGIFRQVIENCQQKELPDYWLTKGNPWEIMRLDIKYPVKFWGYLRTEVINGKPHRAWEGGREVIAIAFDTVIPGWNTFMCNTLRLWKSFPSEEFDFQSFSKGDYQMALEEKDSASYITSVLYPNDSTRAGKELRLRQQYFFCAATISDIMCRFCKTGLPWSEFPKLNAIQLNDTHPAIAIPELLRQLVDVRFLEYPEAFDIVVKTFSYTNHTVLPEALEKWPVDLLANLLPRHMELIFLINYFFLEDLRKVNPRDIEKIAKCSIIEEVHPKLVRMANLCIICSHKVNGVAAIHSSLLRSTLFKEFDQIFPGKFINITNGITPRRWIHCAFPELSNLITEYYGSQDWLSELSLIESLPKEIKKSGETENFIKKFSIAKSKAKLRLINWVAENLGISIDESFMFDVQVKRIHEYKRQIMNALYCVHRYLAIKGMTMQEKEKLIKRVTFFGGKAASGYWDAKNVIRFINMLSKIINSDSDVKDYFQVIFLPDYKVSLAQIIIPAADLSQHISTAGMEASGTSNMKFAMTGSLILGTKDGANIEIAKEIGEENVFFFGYDVNEVARIRNEMRAGRSTSVDRNLERVINTILSGRFGDCGFMRDYFNRIRYGGDYYLVCHDFASYLQAQARVDNEYSDLTLWYTKALVSISKMGYFSSDRSIQDYSDQIWKLTPVEVPKPSNERNQRIVSTSNLRALGGKETKIKRSKTFTFAII